MVAAGPTGSIARAVTGSLVSSVAGQAMLVVSGVIVARLLGVTGRGTLALLALVPTMLSQLGPLGLPAAVTFEMAASHGRRAREVVRAAAGQAAGTSAVLVLAHPLAIWLLTARGGDEVRLAGLLTLVALPGQLAQEYGLALLQGRGQYGALSLVRQLPALSYATAALLLLAMERASLPAAAGLWAASCVVSGAISLTVGLRSLPASVPSGPEPDRRAMLRFGLRSMIGSATPLETFRIDQALVGLLMPAAALGLYVAGLAFSNLPRLLAHGLALVVYPHIAAQPDLALARRSMWRAARWTVILSGVPVLVLLPSVDRLLPLLFGAEFEPAVPIARLLVIAGFLLSLRRTLCEGAKGAGMPGLGTVAEIVSWVSFLAGAAVAMPRLGLHGVAIAVVAASLTSLAVAAGLAWREGGRAAGRDGRPRPVASDRVSDDARLERSRP